MQLHITKTKIALTILALIYCAHLYTTYKLMERVALHEVYLTQIVQAIQKAQQEAQQQQRGLSPY
jgi:hypothetical protein